MFHIQFKFNSNMKQWNKFNNSKNLIGKWQLCLRKKTDWASKPAATEKNITGPNIRIICHKNSGKPLASWQPVIYQYYIIYNTNLPKEIWVSSTFSLFYLAYQNPDWVLEKRWKSFRMPRTRNQEIPRITGHICPRSILRISLSSFSFRWGKAMLKIQTDHMPQRMLHPQISGMLMPLACYYHQEGFLQKDTKLLQSQWWKWEPVREIYNMIFARGFILIMHMLKHNTFCHIPTLRSIPHMLPNTC